MDSKAAVIECESLSKSFRMISLRAEVLALDSLTFSAREGDVVLLQGKNGSGKSTALNLMAGLYKPSSGRVSIMSSNPRRVRRGVIGYLPERVEFHSGISIEIFLKLLARLSGTSFKRVNLMMDEFNLLKWKQFSPDVFSAGMKRKFGLAAAFLQDPAVILLDEPFESLDEEAREFLRDKIKSCSDDGKTVILADHSGDFESLATKIIRLKEGRMC
ncbi:MAG: ATP-binding cassette domain-containing protein [Candidatus Hodarchaeales archaeon]